ncbi:hypothetical protein PPTG_20045, partial [Phytophthora nicotianae INRA-310]
LSDKQLDEYLEHFEWEEIGEYGDESTIELWENMLDGLIASTALNSAENDGSLDSEATTEGNFNGDLDRDCHITGEGATTANNSDNCLPFTTPRLGTHADPIPVADQQPYPEENDPDFPQEKRLTGIRA